MRPYGTWRIGAWTASQPPSEWEWEREGERKGPGRWRKRGSATAVDTCRTTKLFRKFLGRVQEFASTSLRFNTAQIDNDITIPPPRPHDRLVDLHNTSWVYSINWVRIERGGMRRRSCGLPSRRDNSCENDHPLLWCWWGGATLGRHSDHWIGEELNPGQSGTRDERPPTSDHWPGGLSKGLEVERGWHSIMPEIWINCQLIVWSSGVDGDGLWLSRERRRSVKCLAGRGADTGQQMMPLPLNSRASVMMT